ncbi:hypothetical protein EASAB2608_04702 [Streptomyces sp. EAS-AB2608]|uniref:Uncharacterized protein n=1 Tax=Streptomyces bangladeshensis TaxID=295352 RepID=A0ABN3C5Z2_9ACTN|nr:hypothetical protein EASAB2608_04702 [Streptomyces sp. EAS-AB2608]
MQHRPVQVGAAAAGIGRGRAQRVAGRAVVGDGRADGRTHAADFLSYDVGAEAFSTSDALNSGPPDNIPGSPE